MNGFKSWFYYLTLSVSGMIAVTPFHAPVWVSVLIAIPFCFGGRLFVLWALKED